MIAQRNLLRLLAPALLCLAPVLTEAQSSPPACDATRFLDVSSWTGTVTIIGTGSGTYNDAFGRTFSYEIHQSISLAPSFAAGPTSPHYWSGTEIASVSVNDTYTEVEPLGPGAG